ncbi:hypothetical protein EDD91_4798 [Streptomyces sp. KS 21]|nr:hypothetical protein EDD91_4798 [Streptomyces sp. KS 21]
MGAHLRAYAAKCAGTCAGTGPKVRPSVQTRYASGTFLVVGDQEATSQLPVADFHAST